MQFGLVWGICFRKFWFYLETRQNMKKRVGLLLISLWTLFGNMLRALNLPRRHCCSNDTNWLALEFHFSNSPISVRLLSRALITKNNSGCIVAVSLQTVGKPRSHHGQPSTSCPPGRCLSDKLDNFAVYGAKASPWSSNPNPIGSIYGIIYANIWGMLMVNVTIYSIHGSYGNRITMQKWG